MAETLLFTVGTKAAAGAAASAGTAVTLGTVATYAGYGLTALSAVSSVQQGAAQRATAGAQARQQELQVKESKIAAEAAKLQARRKYLQTVASARAAYGAQGVDVGMGTPAAAELLSRGNLGADINTLNRQKQLTAAQGMEQAAQTRKAGSAAFSSGITRGLTTLGSLATI